jgi:hypothetical protein
MFTSQLTSNDAPEKQYISIKDAASQSHTKEDDLSDILSMEEKNKPKLVKK